MGIEAWSTTAASNNASPPDGAPEGQTPGSVNNVIRQCMASVREWYEDAQWVNFGHTPTRTDNDTFSVAGDLTAIYQVGRRLKVDGSATGYCTISASTFSTPNTIVDVTMDSGNLPVTLSTVYVGILSSSSHSMPSPLPAISGANLTALNATNIASGTLADGRLSSNVPLKNAANTFTASQVLSVAGNAGWTFANTSGSTTAELTAASGSASLGTITNHPFSFYTNNTTRGAISAAGNWTINAASSGDELTVNGSVVATSFAGDGSGLTAMSATQLTSGTVPDARFPATLPAASGANLTALNATQLTSGTVPDARFPATLPAASGANLTALNATNIASGTLDNARLPATINAATDLQINSASIFASGTFTATLTGCTTSPTGTATWYRAGNIVTLVLPVLTGTSNTTACTITGLPAGIQPATLADQYQRLAICVDNGSNVDAIARIQDASGTITLNKASLAAFTASGTKGLSVESVITYLLT